MSTQRSRRRIVASASVGLASACGGGDSVGDATLAAADEGQTVTPKLIAFKPERLSVAAATA